MINSMTAFASAQENTEIGEISLELKSVNHRYLDLNFRLAEPFRFMEVELRNILSKQFKRGKLDLTVNYNSANAQSKIQLNENIIQQLSGAMDEMQHSILNLAPVTALDLLKWPGVISGETVNKEHLQEQVIIALNKAIDAFKSVRKKEGVSLAEIILQRVDLCEQEVAKVKEVAADLTRELRQKIQDKINNFAVEVNSERLEQEVVMAAQKADIAEEIDRLSTHLNEVRDIVAKGGIVGRRLDFLMQELNREANTLGSKATNVLTTNVSVELKVLIEQMREQIQNIE